MELTMDDLQTEDAPTPLSTDTAESLKSTIVSTMISLSASPNLQVQIGEAIAVMAEADFPDKWEGLIEVSRKVEGDARR
jgi:exportin-2 (importin alpha re-exporter)